MRFEIRLFQARGGFQRRKLIAELGAHRGVVVAQDVEMEFRADPHRVGDDQLAAGVGANPLLRRDSRISGYLGHEGPQRRIDRSQALGSGTRLCHGLRARRLRNVQIRACGIRGMRCGGAASQISTLGAPHRAEPAGISLWPYGMTTPGGLQMTPNQVEEQYAKLEAENNDWIACRDLGAPLPGYVVGDPEVVAHRGAPPGSEPEVDRFETLSRWERRLRRKEAELLAAMGGTPGRRA